MNILFQNQYNIVKKAVLFSGVLLTLFFIAPQLTNAASGSQSIGASTRWDGTVPGTMMFSRARAEGPTQVNPDEVFNVELYAWCTGDDYSGASEQRARFDGVNSTGFNTGSCAAPTVQLVETRSVTAPSIPGTYTIDLYSVLTNPANPPNYVPQPANKGVFTYEVVEPGSLTANPTTILEGQQVTFEWTCPASINSFGVNWIELSGLGGPSHYEPTAGGNPDSYVHTFNTAGSYTVQAECIAANASGPVSGAIETRGNGSVVITVNAAPAAIDITPTSLDFGDTQTGTSKDLTFTVTNTGGGTLNLDANPVISGAFGARYSCVSASCSSAQSLGNGNSVTYTVRYAPNTESNGQTANLQVTGTFTENVPLTGNGVAPALPPSPTASFDPPTNPTVDYNDPHTFSWSSFDADSCELERVTDGVVWSGLGTSGSITTLPLTADVEYTIRCRSAMAGTWSPKDNLYITVNPPACTTGPIVNMGGLNRITPTDDTCDGNQTLFTETPNSAAVAAASCRDYECPDCTAANGYKGIFGKYIDVTCGALPPPPLSPSAAIGVKVNGGATEYNDLTGASALEITDSIEIEWGSSGAGTCNATLGPGFDTGGAINGTDPVPNPGSGSTQTYTVNCDGDTDSITVEVEQASNLTIAFNPVGFPNLTPELDGDGNPTGSFTDVELQVIVSETGGVAVSTSFDVELAFDLNGDTTYDDSHTFTVNSIPANGAVPLTHTFNSFVIPFTPASVARAQVDIPLVGNGVITETNEGDNQATLSPIPSTLPAPNLNLELDPSDLVRGGGSVDIDYNTNAVYDMDCTLSGPGLSPDHTFNPSNPAQGPTGTLTATNITAKSIYTLSCTENITGTNQVFTETASVETTGSVEET